MSIPQFMLIHVIVIEIFQSGLVVDQGLDRPEDLTLELKTQPQLLFLLTLKLLYATSLGVAALDVWLSGAVRKPRWSAEPRWLV